MRILVDLDNTINHLSKIWLHTCNVRFGDNFETDDLNSIPCWNWPDLSKGGQKAYDLLLEPGLFANAPIMPNAREVLEDLHNRHEIFIVTAANPQNVPEKAIWIEKYLPFLSFKKNVIVATNKTLIEGDILFDDNADDNLIPWSKVHKNGIGVAMSAGYNKQYTGVRVDTWLEFADFINIVESLNNSNLTAGLYMYKKEN